MKNRTDIQNFFITIEVVLIILNSGSLIVRTLNDDLFYILELLVVLLIYIRIKEKHSLNMLHYGIFMFLLVVHMTLFPGATKSYIGLSIRITSLFLFAMIIGYIEFWKKYISIIELLSILSLVGFVIINIVPQNLIHKVSQIFILVDPAYNRTVEYNNLIFITWKIRHFGSFIRNQSIFWEPGAFQFFVNLALIVNLNYEKNIFTRRNSIFILAVLSTFSTTGYIVMVLIMISRIRLPNLVKFKVKQIAIALGLLFTAILFTQSWVIAGKFDPGSVYYNSFAARKLHSQYLFEIVKENPFTGIGYGAESLKKIDTFANNFFNIGSSGGSNQLLRFLGQFGLIIGGIYLFPLFFTKRFIKNRLIYIAILIAWLSTEHFVTSEVVLAMIYIKST